MLKFIETAFLSILSAFMCMCGGGGGSKNFCLVGGGGKVIFNVLLGGEAIFSPFFQKSAIEKRGLYCLLP